MRVLQAGRADGLVDARPLYRRRGGKVSAASVVALRDGIGRYDNGGSGTGADNCSAVEAVERCPDEDVVRELRNQIGVAPLDRHARDLRPNRAGIKQATVVDRPG